MDHIDIGALVEDYIRELSEDAISWPVSRRYERATFFKVGGT